MGKDRDHSNQGGGYDDANPDREIERLSREDQARQEQAMQDQARRAQQDGGKR